MNKTDVVESRNKKNDNFAIFEREGSIWCFPPGVDSNGN